jgi:hypothetical protein
MYDAKLGTILFVQLHVIIETYKQPSFFPTSAPSMSLSTSFSVDILFNANKKSN